MRSRGSWRVWLLSGLVWVVPLSAGSASYPQTSASEASTPEDPPANVVRWKSQNEEGVYGYLVYRSESREGPFVRVSPRIVRVSEEPETVHSYSFSDPDVEPGRTYFYYLDTVRTTGEKERFSGVVSKTTASRPEDP